MASNSLRDVTVLVVAYNSAAVISGCLAPLAGAAAVVVVDNASTDGSADRVRAVRPDATVIRNDANPGYGTAVNQGLARVTTPFALIVNPDAVVSAAAAERLLAAARDPRVAIAAPFLHSPGRGLELTAAGPGDRTPGPIEPTPEGDYCTWFATGAVWLLRVDAWRDLGGFDEEIFLYGEDFDFCRRLTAAGKAIVGVPEARGEHLVSRATAPSAKIRWRKEWNIVWSHLYVTGKFRGAAEARAEAWRLLARRAPKALFYALVLDRKRFFRDAAIAHAAWSFLLGRKPRRGL